MKTKRNIRMTEYKARLLEQRKQEKVKTDVINDYSLKKENLLSSPTTATTTEETKLLMDYMNISNLLNISKHDAEKGKVITLKQFLKAKRNQQVEIYSRLGGETNYTEAKVNAVGRDFVMLTNVTERVWIPYSFIESANTPYGIPTYSNSHQHYIYDNDLRNKLLRNFGETVSKRDILKQQFFEESLETNLNTWRDTFIEIHLSNSEKIMGQIIKSEAGVLTLRAPHKKRGVTIKEIQLIKSLRFYQGVILYLKTFWKKGKEGRI